MVYLQVRYYEAVTYRSRRRFVVSRTQILMATKKPTQIGNYRIIREIGRGGMGAVYEAEHLRVKNRDTCTPLGPWLVDAADVPNPQALALQTTVNGKVTQSGNTRDMIFDVPFLIEYFSSFMTLNPGDLILTGTPAGTALSAPPKPIEMIGALLPPALKWKAFFKRQAANPKYLTDGDVVEASIATDDGIINLGSQRNTVKDHG